MVTDPLGNEADKCTPHLLPAPDSFEITSALKREKEGNNSKIFKSKISVCKPNGLNFYRLVWKSMKNPVVVGRSPSCLFPASFERLLPLHSPAMAMPALWSLLLPGGC